MTFRADKNSTTPTIDDVNKQLTGAPTWGPDLVSIAINAHQEEKNKLGKEFNCFVLVRPTTELEKKGDEFVEFLDHLKNNFQSFENKTSFQLAVCDTSKKHWTAFDLLIKDNQLHVLCFDAANDASADASLSTLMKRFPECNAVRLEPDKLIGASLPRLIQFDNESCSRMTIEHIFLLSQAHLLEKLKLDTLNTDSSGVKLVGPKEILPIAPSLYRTTQSLSVIASFGTQRLSVSDSGHTLQEFVSEHTAEDKRTKKLQNKAIDKLKEDFINNIRVYCQTNGEEKIRKVLKSRKEEALQFADMEASARENYIRAKTANIPIKDRFTILINTMKNNNIQIIAKENARLQQAKENKTLKQYTPAAFANFEMRVLESIKIKQEMQEQLEDILKEIQIIPEEKQKDYIKRVLNSSLSPEIRKNIEQATKNYFLEPVESKAKKTSASSIYSMLQINPATTIESKNESKLEIKIEEVEVDKNKGAPPTPVIEAEKTPKAQNPEPVKTPKMGF